MPTLRYLPVVLLLVLADRTAAQNYVISTVAGLGIPTSATGAFGRLGGIATDAAGRLYVVAPDRHCIFRLEPGGTVVRVAGTCTPGYSGDGGLATDAQLFTPFGIAIDNANNLYIADYGNNRIRRVGPTGIITTVAGNGSAGYTGDGGPAQTAALDEPLAVTAATDGTLYIADSGNSVVRKVSTAGVITTIAGNGRPGYSADETMAVNAQLNYPSGVFMDASGSLYIAEAGNARICKISPTGVITTTVGVTVPGYSGDGGPATEAALDWPTALTGDSNGNIYLADSMNSRVRKITPAGTILTVAGNGTFDYSGESPPALSATLDYPTGVAVTATGTVYVSDSYNYRVRAIGPQGLLTTVLGNGTSYSGDGSPAIDAQLSRPHDIALDRVGNLYVVDTGNARVRKISPDGTISTVAGNGTWAKPGDRGLEKPLAISDSGSVALSAIAPVHLVDSSVTRALIAHSTQYVQEQISRKGAIAIVSGNGTNHSGGDLGGMASDSAGNLYMAAWACSCVRKLTPSGAISVAVGRGTHGFSGDGGMATAAELDGPHGVAVDANDNLYIADSLNSRIRRVTPAGVITTIAGNGEVGYSGDGGSATSARLAHPWGVVAAQNGKLYFTEVDSNVIRSLDKAASPLWTIASIHSGDIVQGDIGALFELTVSNVGLTTATGAATVTETVSNGLTVTGMSGTGWSCDTALQSCTRRDGLVGGGSFSVITVTVTVAGDAPPRVISTSTVFEGGVGVGETEDAVAVLVASVSTAAAVDSVAPSTGSGPGQTFALEYSDARGAAYLASVSVLFSSSRSTSLVSSCAVKYDTVAGKVYLANDLGTGWIASVPGASGSSGNGQCTVDLNGTTVQESGKALVLMLPISFSSAFDGDKAILMIAVDRGGSMSGWRELGYWSVGGATAVAVAALSCLPSSLLSGASSTCTVTLSKAAGTGGASVSLSSSIAALTVPAAVTVAPGSATALFTATAGSVGVDQTAIVTASYGVTSKTVNIQLMDTTVLTAVSCFLNDLSTSISFACTVSLSKAAGSGGATVSLSRNLAELAVPSTVTVASGSVTGQFSATVSTLNADQMAIVTASYNGGSQTTSLSWSADPPTLSLSCTNTTVSPESSTTCSLQSDTPAGPNGLDISVDVASELDGPDHVTIAQGTSATVFTVARSTCPALVSKVPLFAHVLVGWSPGNPGTTHRTALLMVPCCAQVGHCGLTTDHISETPCNSP